MIDTSSKGRPLRTRLALFVVLFGGYYAIVAFFPRLLALPAWPGSAIPLSLPLALGLIWAGFVFTLYLARQP